MSRLFNRPAWGNSQAVETGESSDIFNHSERSYPYIVAEKERKKKEKLEKKQAKEKRKSSELEDEDDHGRVKDEPPTIGTFKRRRITSEDTKALLGKIGVSSRNTTAQRDDWRPVIFDDESSIRRSPRTNRNAKHDSPRKTLRGSEIITLDDDEDQSVEEDIVYDLPPSARVEIEDDSDEEFAELARKARREREQKELLKKKPHTSDFATRATSPDPNVVNDGSQYLPTPPPDPVVQILVTSPLPDTAPLIVHRKLSQRVREIRLAWCSKQGFSDEKTNSVFFMHRMRKIYDSTTCRSLGLDVDATGEIVMKGAEDKEGADKIHLEAVTEELFAQMKADKAMEAKRRSGELIPEDTQAGAEDVGEAEDLKSEQSTIRLILKSKSQKDFKMLVKANTLFSKILNAYRKSHSLDDSTEIYLEFDGDRLHPNDEVQSTDIQDKDILSVHIS